MNTYVIKKINDDCSFEDVPELKLENRYFDTPKSTEVTAKIAYSDRALYVYLKTVEKAHRAEEKGALGEPYHDSCLEFFFAPSEDRISYFNFEFNSNKCLYLGYRDHPDNGARLLVDVQERFSPKIKFTGEGWEIKYSIPYSFIRIFAPSFDPKPGSRMRANCFKCADRMCPEEYLSWSPVTTEGFTFHKPECFGLMVFGD